jgi:serine/threonine protein kinase
MNSESSSFDNNQNFSPLINTISDIVPINKNGATSDCFKVRIHAKWHFLKRPKKTFSTNPLYVAAFEKEFDLGFTLEHPNIVRYLSKGTDKDGIYILTEYIDGQTLSDFKFKNPDFFKKEENIRKLLLQLLSALDYLHNRQIVHLDLKPDNILITTNGNNIKLIDLGLSYSDCYNEITGGTQSFGSPEQFFKPNLIDYRSDLYAFGKIVLYIFTGDTSISSIWRLPARYKKLVGKCLIEDVERRNIKADECIKLINQKNRFPVLLIIGLLMLLSYIILQINKPMFLQHPVNLQNKDNTVSTKNIPLAITKNDFKEKAVINKETIAIPAQIYPINKVVKRHGNSVENTKAMQSFIAYKLRKEFGDSAKILSKEDSVEGIIKLFIRERFISPSSVFDRAYSDINEFNVNVLRKSFEDWKQTCTADCNLLYKDYKHQISFEKFKTIYNNELKKINSPIQKRLDEFK